MKKTNLSSELIKQVIAFCNRDLVPDSTFRIGDDFPSNWFVKYFSFLGNSKLEKYLGEAFYQARFSYKLMMALRLPVYKYSAMVKFQIIQYASICEAILQEVIEKNYKADFENQYAVTEYTKCGSAMAKDVKITQDGTELILCKTKIRKADIKRERIDHKTEFAVQKGIIMQGTKEDIDKLYNARNNIHILKAVGNNYVPKLRESKEAFLLMQKLVSEVKAFYSEQF